MKEYVNEKDRHTAEETDYSSGKPVTKYFRFYCDICGAGDDIVYVDELTKEEGFPEDGDYCWNCQASMREQGFVGKDKTIYFWKKDYENVGYFHFFSMLKEKGYNHKKLINNKKLFESIIRLYEKPGLVGFDFADVKTQIDRNKKLKYKEEIKTKKTLKSLKNLNKDILFLIDIPKTYVLADVTEIMDIIGKIIPDSMILFQFYIDPKLKDKFRLRELIFYK